MNIWAGVGNLGRDPEIKHTSDGKTITNFSIAISSRYRDKSGVMQESTEWVPIVCFGRLAEIAAEYLTKGSSISVQGKFKTDSYEKDGEKRYSTKIVADNFQMLGSKNHAKAAQDSSPRQAPSRQEADADIPF